MSNDINARLQEALADRDARLVVMTAERDRLSAQNFMLRERVELLERTIEGHGNMLVDYEKVLRKNEELLLRHFTPPSSRSPDDTGEDRDQDKDWGC